MGAASPGAAGIMTVFEAADLPMKARGAAASIEVEDFTAAKATEVVTGGVAKGESLYT